MKRQFQKERAAKHAAPATNERKPWKRVLAGGLAFLLLAPLLQMGVSALEDGSGSLLALEAPVAATASSLATGDNSTPVPSSSLATDDNSTPAPSSSLATGDSSTPAPSSSLATGDSSTPAPSSSLTTGDGSTPASSSLTTDNSVPMDNSTAADEESDDISGDNALEGAQIPSLFSMAGAFTALADEESTYTLNFNSNYNRVDSSKENVIYSKNYAYGAPAIAPSLEEAGFTAPEGHYLIGWSPYFWGGTEFYPVGAQLPEDGHEAMTYYAYWKPLGIMNWTASNYTETYNALAHTFAIPSVNNVTTTTVNYSYLLDGEATTLEELGQLTEAGTYTITVRATAENYHDSEKSITVTINPAPLEISPEFSNDEILYGNSVSTEYKLQNVGEAKGPMAADVTTLNTALTNAGVLFEIFDSENQKVSDITRALPGTYTIRMSDETLQALQANAAFSNYSLEKTEQPFIITAQTGLTLQLGAAPYSGIYDAKSHPILDFDKLSVVVQREGLQIPAHDVSYFYSTNGADGTFLPLSSATSLPTVTSVADAATQPIWVRVESPGYLPDTVKVQATITRAELIVRSISPDAAIPYDVHGITLPTLEYAFGDFSGAHGALGTSTGYENDLRAELEASPDFELSTTATENSPVGNYLITVEGPETLANYKVEYRSEGHVDIVQSEGLVLAQVNGYHGDYDANTHNAFTYAVLEDGEPITTGFILEFSLAGEDGPFEVMTTSNRPTVRNANEDEPVNYWLRARMDGYEPSAVVQATATVNRADLYVHAQDEQQLYGIAIPTTFGYDFTNADGQETLPTAENEADVREELESHSTGTTAFRISTNATQNSPFGLYDIDAQGPAQLTNYDVHYIDGKLTIEKLGTLQFNLADITASAYNGEYDAINHNMLNAVPTVYDQTGSVVDMSVAGSFVAYSQNINDMNAFVTEIPLIRNAGNYNLYVGAYHPGYDFALTTVPIHSTITPAPLEISVLSHQSIPYNTTPNLNYTASPFKGNDRFEDLGIEVDVTTTVTNTTLPGTYPLNISGPTVSQDGNYTQTGAGNYTLRYVGGQIEITENGELSVNANAYNGTYDAQNHDVVYDVSSEAPGARYEYSVNGGPFVDTAIPTIRDAGEYTVQIRVSAPGYESKTITVKATIAKRPVLVTVGAYEKTEGAQDPTFTAFFNGLQGSDTLAHQISREEGEEVGRYDVTASVTENPNYIVTVENGYLNILAAGTTAPIPPTTPTTPTTPTIPTTPDVPFVPEAPEVPEALELPGLNGTPDIPETTETPDVAPDAPAPDAQNVAVAPTDAAGENLATRILAALGLADFVTNMGINIGDTNIPLAAAGGHWALVNLLLTIFTVLSTVVLAIGHFIQKHKEREGTEEDAQQHQTSVKRKTVAIICSALVSILSMVVFLLTENMNLPMALFDYWSILMLVMSVAQVLFFVLAHAKRTNQRHARHRHKA